MKITSLDQLEKVKEEGLRLIYPEKTKISVGMATCGLATGAKQIYEATGKFIYEKNLDMILTKTGCLGYCQKEPIIDILVPGMPKLTYMEMTPEKTVETIDAIVNKKTKKDQLLCKTEEEEFIVESTIKSYNLSKSNHDLQDIIPYQKVPFFSKQKKIVLRNCGFINADSIEEYIARGGYKSLYKALATLSPGEVIKEIKDSGLRGRGGAGFPTGLKWELCRKSPDKIKYIICNADEGDPGAYMDRSVLEGDPHSVLEGMLTGAYAIGASEGYIYIRTEYPLAIEKLRQAITQAKEYGLLGENIFASGFSFDIEIREGSGAFVCGEETSLIASIEGRPAEPRQRPPFPTVSGLWGRPTNINNVETWANIPVIIARGADWFFQFGTVKSKGTKVFSLVGKINNTGLVEVPMGITLKEIIFDIGGGIPEGKRFKAVQTGGPSGGCIPSTLLNLPVDYERLREAGSIMGSGGMVVMDEDTCVVDIAKYFIEFTNEESCGKCTACREGSAALLEVLTRISEGKGEDGDIDFLEELGEAIKDASLCGLGQTVPNPVLSTLQHFREEYEIHIKEKECLARVCKRLTPTPCQNACPVGIDVPSYIALIARGKHREALELIREDNPFPAVCGRLCSHPCENECRRIEVDQPLAICALKRFVADREIELGEQMPVPIEKKYEEKVAVIGSGPAGLTTAYFLARSGYGVTVFEAMPVAGGMLTVGIPEFILPSKIIKHEIAMIEALGVEIKTNTRIGKDLTLENIKQQGYQALFIAIGAHRELKSGIPGEDEFEGVLDCLSFLGNQRKPGDKVIIIGGDNIAFTTARTCLRLGSKEVNIVYRRSRNEIPVEESKIETSQKEGIKIHYLTAPNRIIGLEGKVTGLQCVRTELGEPDPVGRRRPFPIKDSEFVIDTDTIISVVGQEPDLSFLPQDHQFEISKWNHFVVDSETLQTTVPGIFAGGDSVTGPATVIEAIAAGKRAAVSIDSYLRGRTFTFGRPKPKKVIEEVELTEEMEGLERAALPILPVKKRIKSFEEVELHYDKEVAILEAKRCLRCDLY